MMPSLKMISKVEETIEVSIGHSKVLNENGGWTKTKSFLDYYDMNKWIEFNFYGGDESDDVMMVERFFCHYEEEEPDI